MQPISVAPTASAGTNASTSVEREVPFRFTGSAGEYFRIWIVNVALTIVTLGIYSAWAKVRTKRYFYRHTWLEDSSFDYLASPIAILKGRIVIAVFIGLVFAAQYYSLVLYGAMFVVALVLTPFIVVKALAFNAKNSAYRNVRFAFLGNAGEAYGVYMQMGLVHLLSCGLGYPYAQWRFTSFVVERHLYGAERFRWFARAGDYFRVFAIGLVITAPLYVALFLVSLNVFEPSVSGQPNPGAVETGSIAILVVMYAILLVPAAYIRANIANVLYGSMAIGPHRLRANQQFGDLLKLYATNALAVIASLGLLTPWAMIRLARYRAEHLVLLASGPLVASNYEMAPNANAVGEAATDLGDFDFDIGA